MNAWPPKPGCTLMNRRMSISSRYGSTASSGVSGLSTSPTRMPWARIRSNSGRGSPSSTCTVQESAPALAKSSSRSPGLSIIRWQSRYRSVRGRRHLTTGAPIERFGTKWPSITSTCSRSACGRIRSTSAASSAKSAAGSTVRSFPWRSTLTGAVRRAGQDEEVHPVGAGRLREQQCASPPRPPRCARRRLGDEAGQRARAPTRRRRSSRPAVSVHTEYTSRPPGRTIVAAAREQLALQRGELVDRVGLDPPARLRSAPQHPEARARRVEQHAVEGVRPERQSRGRRPRPESTAASPSRVAARRTRSSRPACDVDRHDEPRSSIASASAVALPPGAAPTSSTRSPGRVRRPPRRPPGSPGPAASRGRRRRPASCPGSPPPRTISASGQQPAPCSTVAPVADELGRDLRPTVARRGFDPQRQRRRLVRQLQRGPPRPRHRDRRRAGRRSSPASTCGSRPRSTESPSGQRPRRPERRDPAEHRVHVSLRRGARCGRARRRSRRPRRAARRPSTSWYDAEAQRGADRARRGRRGRGRGPARAVRRATAGGAACRRPARWSAPARVAPCRGRRAAGRGSSTFAYAPSSTRTSASIATSRGVELGAVTRTAPAPR